MARPGRPSKLTKEVYDKIPELVRLGLPDKKVADILGIPQSTFATWVTKNREFQIAYNIEKAKADNAVEKSLFKRAVGYSIELERGKMGTVESHYPGDVQAQIFWLKNRRSEQWQDKPEVTVNTIQMVRIENANGTRRADFNVSAALPSAETNGFHPPDTSGS